mgnify:FL=1
MVTISQRERHRQLMVTIANNLRILRKSKGWTQHDLAKKSGVSRVSIARFETASRMPDFDTMCSLADALGVSTEIFRENLPNLL